MEFATSTCEVIGSTTNCVYTLTSTSSLLNITTPEFYAGYIYLGVIISLSVIAIILMIFKK